MPASVYMERLKKAGEWLRRSPRMRFVIYALFLFLLAARLSDYGNIDLMSYWRDGHGLMWFLSLFPTALLIHLFCFWRRGGGVLLFLWLLFIGAQIYVLRMMNFRISFGIISNFFETDTREAASFVTLPLLATVAITLVGSVLFVWGMNRLRGQVRKPYYWLCGLLLLVSVGNAVFVPKEKKEAVGTVLWPFHNMGEIGDLIITYWWKERPLMQSLANLPSTAAPESRLHTLPGGLTVFFHFGETARADHWSLNGYARSTTPFAEAAAKEGRLINFPKTLSYAAGTRLGAVGLLTPARLGKIMPEYGPFFDLYQKHGFDLRAFRSNQTADDQIYDSTLITFSKLFKGKTVFHPDTSDALVPHVESYLKESEEQNRFLFYYGEGSHAPYYYGEKYARFLPDDMDRGNYGRTHEEAINRYDNSIYATDQFMREVTERLKDTCAIYIYTSDHGEYLGEKGRYSHGINTMCDREIRCVPFCVWVSPAFEKARPELVARLRKNAATFPVISHDHLFHTILGLSGIESPVYEARWDLSSDEALPYTGKMPEDIPESYVFDSLGVGA